MSVEKGLDHTNIREHFDTALNRALLDWNHPVAMVDPEHCLQQLHKDRLPRLRGETEETQAADFKNSSF